jgi:enamine deaminase RidA (YjgF/YER057c/UK114 family)
VARPRAGLCGAGAGVFRSLQAQVEAGGGTLADIVKITTFLTDIRYREELVLIREEFFGRRRRPSARSPSPRSAGRNG